jgi:hypothetical protein
VHDANAQRQWHNANGTTPMAEAGYQRMPTSELSPSMNLYALGFTGSR